MQVEQTWKGKGQVLHALEMLTYDPAKRLYTDYGFGSDGSTWFLTATFDGARMIERGGTKGADGVVTTCQMTWTFGADWTSLSGTQQCDRNGTRWTAVDVRGKKSKAGE